MPNHYIIGHKNPDTDSICSAIAYADYKHRIGEPQYVAARCGATNARIDAVLNRFNVPAPLFVGDVTPRVKDMMVTKMHKTRPSRCCFEALELLEKYDIRVLPVVDIDNTLLGQVSIFRLGEFFVPRRVHTKEVRKVYTTLQSISTALNARVHTITDPDRPEELYIRVGAVSSLRFQEIASSQEIPMEQSILVVGDREEMQRVAVEAGVRLIVLTLDTQPEPWLMKAAEEKGISIMTSSYDSANTAWIIRSAHRLQKVYQRNVDTYSADEALSSVRKRALTDIANVFFVADEQNHLCGVFTKGDLFRPIQKSLVLVDHNEVTQAVDGASEVQITEIIDHHRLGNPPTQAPIRFINEPVGSTCTIIADMFRKDGITPTPATAGLMMSGIITDTLNLQSPTATVKDATILTWLASIGNIPIAALSEHIFSQGSILLSSPPKEALGIDQKTYNEGDDQFIIAQVEEIGFDRFWQVYKDLLKEVKALRERKGAIMVALMVTDINQQESFLLADADSDILERIKYPEVKPGVYNIGEMVSRKKQVVPYITEVLRS